MKQLLLLLVMVWCSCNHQKQDEEVAIAITQKGDIVYGLLFATVINLYVLYGRKALSE